MAEKLRLDVELNISQTQLNAQTKDIIRRARQLDREFNRIGTGNFSNLTTGFNRGVDSIVEIGAETKRATGFLSQMGQQAGLTARRFITYNVIARTFFALANGVTTLAGEFLKFNSAINRAEQILNPLVTSVDDLKRSVFELGREFGVSLQEVQDAQEIFIRQGLNLRDTIDLTRASLALASATAVSTADATEAITSVLRQFNLEASNAIAVTNKLVATTINFAVEQKDLDQGLRRAASTANIVGVRFEELTGFITAAQEATRRGGEVIGTALRTIFTRLFRTPSIQALEELGIRTRETSGDFRNATGILTDLAAKFQSLSQAQQLSIASTIAGQRQISTLIALLDNFDRATAATNIALNAQGVAAELTRKRQQALEVQLEKVINDLRRFGVSIGDLIGQDIIGVISGIGAAFGTVGEGIKSLATGDLQGIFGSIVSLLTKSVLLIGLQATGLTRIFNTSASNLGLNQKINSTFSEGLKQNRLLLDVEKGKFDINKKFNDSLVRGGEARAREVKVEQLTTKLRQQNKLESEAQLRLVEIIARIESEKLSVKQNELQIQKQLSAETRLQAKEDKVLTAQRSKAATLRRRLEKLSLTPESRATNEEQQLKFGQKLFELTKRRSDLDISTQEKRQQIARNILNNETKIGQLQTELAATLGIKGKRQRNVAEEKIFVELRKTEGEIERATRQLKQQGLEGAVNLELEILRVKKQQLGITEKEEQRRLQQQRAAAELGRLTQQTNRDLNAVSKEREGIEANINKLTQQNNISQQNILNSLNTANKLRAVSVSRQQRVALLTRQIEENQKKLNLALDKQNDKVLAGGRAFGKAFGLSLLLGGISDALRNFGDTSDRTFKAATEAVDGFSSALISLTLAPGPIGLLLAGISAVITISKVFKTLEVDAKKTLETMQDNLDKSVNLTRVFTASLDTLSNATKKVREGGILNVDDLKRIDVTMQDIAKAAGVATDQMLGFRNAIVEAARAGDLQGVNDQLAKMQRFVALRNIAEGNILNQKTIRETLDAYAQAQFKLQELQQTQKDIRGGKTGLLGEDITLSVASGKDLNDKIRTIQDAFGILDGKTAEVNETIKTLFKSFQIEGQVAINTFQQIVDPTLSLQANLKLLGDDTINVLRITGQLNQAYQILAQRQGLVGATSLEALAASQSQEERTNVLELAEAFKQTNGDVRNLTELLDNLGVATNDAAQVGLEFADGFFDTTAGREFLKILADINGVSEQVIKEAIERNGRFAEGVILVKNAQKEWAIVQTETGTTVSLLDKKANELIKTLNGNLIPVSIKAAKATETFNASMISSSIIISSFEQRLQAATRIVQQSTEKLNNLSEATRKTEASLSLIKEVFAEDVFRQPIAGIDALLASVDNSSVALDAIIRNLDRLRTISDESAVAVDDKLRRAMQEGADGAVLFDARIRQSSLGIQKAKDASQEYSATLKELEKDSRTFGFVTSELETLASRRFVLEELAQALNGIVSVRDKIESQTKGAALLERDRKSAEQFLDTIKTILPGVDVENIKKFLQFSGGQRNELLSSLKGLFESIQAEAGKIADPVLRQIVTGFGASIVEAVESASTESGKSSTRTLSNALLEDVTRFTKSSQALFDSFVSAVREFSNKNSDQLKEAINLTQSRLDELAAATAKGAFLPDFSGRDIEILRQNFARIRAAVEREKRLLTTQLTPINQQIANIVKEQEEVRLRQREITPEEQTQQQERLNQLRIEAATIEADIAGIRNTERNVTASFVRQFTVELDRLSQAERNLFTTQDAIVEAEIAIAQQRSEFAEAEAFGVEQRIALIESESSAIERLAREVTGLGEIDVAQIAKSLVNLTGELVEQRRAGADAATIRIIEERIAAENRHLDIIRSINDRRLTSLQRELEIINQQADAVRSLADEFLKANDSQQKEIINSARLVEEFFGNLTPEALDSRQFTQSAARFLRETNDELRNSVITQLERLKNVGGEVAPGVQAEQVLRQLSESVVGALFKSPQQAVLEKQREIQGRMLEVLKDANQIAELQNRLAIQATADIRRSVDALLLEGAQGTLDPNEETIKQARKIQESLTVGQERIAQINKEREKSERSYSNAAETSVIRNKALVDVFSKLDTTIGDTQESAEDYQKKLVDLRDAFVKAEDDFIDAQDAYNQALASVGAALTKGAVAQADYALQIELAQRQNLAIAGSFQTFRDEISFLQNAFTQQINALKAVGAAEEEIANLRVRLAQETLSVIENEIQTFRSNAERLFAGGLDVAQDFQQNFAAAQLAATQARAVGITPGQRATEQQTNELFQRLAVLPADVKQGILDGLRAAPPNAVFEGFSPTELENAILAGAGGGIRGDTLLELEKQASIQRQIIAENSIQGLVSARQGVITAFDQLATSQEQLVEARAMRDLAQLQLEAANTTALSSERTVDLLADLITNVQTLNFRSAGVPNAAMGSLTGSEVAGLLRAASREKMGMPAGSRLGVFNTSETVLTRSQMNRLHRGAAITNAANGTAAVIDGEVVGLLQQISDKLTVLNSGGALDQNFNIDINNQRMVTIQGLAGLQTALQDILTSRTSDLYTREEAQALERIVMTVVQKMQQTGQISAIGT